MHVLHKQIRRNSEKLVQKSRLRVEQMLLLPVLALGVWVHYWELRIHQKAREDFVAMQTTSAQKSEEQI